MSSISSQFGPLVSGLLALEQQKFFPWTYNTIAPSFFIISSSNLQITMTTIKAQTSSNSRHICPLTSSYLPLSTEKNVVDTIFDRNFFKFSDSEDRRKIMDKFHFRPEWTSLQGYMPLSFKNFSHRLIMEKMWTQYKDFFFCQIIIKLTGDLDRDEISALEFQPLLSIYFRVTCP